MLGWKLEESHVLARRGKRRRKNPAYGIPLNLLKCGDNCKDNQIIFVVVVCVLVICVVVVFVVVVIVGVIFALVFFVPVIIIIIIGEEVSIPHKQRENCKFSKTELDQKSHFHTVLKYRDEGAHKQTDIAT